MDRCNTPGGTHSMVQGYLSDGVDNFGGLGTATAQKCRMWALQPSDFLRWLDLPYTQTSSLVDPP